MNNTNIKRRDAAAFIEAVREVMAGTQDPSQAVACIERALELLHVSPLTPCPGSAHDNEVHVDNCSICAPRWGLVGPQVVVR